MTLLTVTEVAARLKVSRRTAYRLIQGMIRTEIGGSLRVPEAALDRYIAERTIDPCLSPVLIRRRFHREDAALRHAGSALKPRSVQQAYMIHPGFSAVTARIAVLGDVRRVA